MGQTVSRGIQNKGELNLNQSNLDSFVKQVTKNNGGCHKIHQSSLIDCFVLVITFVWQTVHTGNGSNSVETVLTLISLIKKCFGH